MICNNCNKENRTDGKFCRFCGSKLGQTKTSITVKLPDLSGLINIIRKQNKKVIIIAVLIVVVGVGTAFAAPKINDYVKVNGFISEALKLESGGDYKAALAALALTSDKWTLESKRQEIESIKEAQTKYAQFKEAFESALEKEGAGKLAEARELLQSIDTNYPEYEKVKEKLNDVQEAIEGNLKEQARLKELEAQRQAAAAAEARRQAQAETAAKERAEAEKAASEAQARAAAQAARDAEIRRQQAEAEKAVSEAQARAAAQAARDAEIRRQQEEQRRVEQVRISFKNQLLTIYDSFNSDGIGYYNNAMSYYNTGYDITAIAIFGQANAIFSKAYSDARSLQTTFSGMPSGYMEAARDMERAADYCMNAVSAAVNETGLANTYSSSCNSYGSRVRSFLSSQGY